MALRPYERKEAIDGRGSRTDFSAPAVADVGQVFGQLSRSLLNMAEPIVRERAIQRGKEDAGAAPLVRDEAGNLRRADPLPGGGLAYRQAFQEAASTLYKGRLVADTELRFEEILAEHPDDPRAAMASMQAHAEAVSETIPADIRAEIEPILLREATQRFNGRMNQKWQEDRRALQQGLEEQYRGREAQYLRDLGVLAEQGDIAGMTALDNQWETFAAENRDARKKIGALTDQGVEGEQGMTQARMGNLNGEVTSVQGMRAIVSRSKELLADPLQLQLLEQWNRGDPSAGEGKVLGMSFDEYLKAIPTEQGRNAVAAWAGQRIADINAQLAAEAAAQKAAEEAEKDEQLRIDVAAFGADVIAGNPKARKEWNEMINRDVAAGQGINQFMLGQGGRDYMKNVVAQTGVLPDTLKTWLTRQAAGTNAHIVAEFIANLDGVRGPQGQYNFSLAWKQLDDDTRAAISRYQSLIDQGVPVESRRAILEDIATGKHRTRNIAAAFPDENGAPSTKLYVEARDKAIEAIFGAKNSRIPEPIRRQIDLDARAYLSAYASDPHAAVRAAVEGAATMWTPHPLGVEGFIPTELAGLNLTPSQLDYAFGNYVPGKGHHLYGGAGFTTWTVPDANGVRHPRARLELADLTQAPAGVGYYRVRYYSREGREIGVRTVNIDRQLATHFGSMAQLEAQARKARIETAKGLRKTAKKLNRSEEQLATEAGSIY